MKKIFFFRNNFFLKTVIFLITFLSSGFLFAHPNGIENCDFIYQSLKKDNYSPIKQNLVSSGNNIFPYNIYFRLNSKEKTLNQNNFLIVINQNDASENIENIKVFLKNLSNIDTKRNIYVLFSYGDNSIFEKENNIQGSQIFLDSIDFKENLIALLIDFDEKENNIISSTHGFTSPYYIVKTVYNNCAKSKLKFKIPGFYLSQSYTYQLETDNTLSTFFNYNIPSVKITLQNDSTHQELITDFLTSIAIDFDNIETNQFDQHFIILRIGKKHVRFTEKAIVITIIILILFLSVFLFLFTFINNRIQKESWNLTRLLWYLIPLTFILIFGSLLLGKYFSILVFKNYSGLHRMIMTATFQFFFAVSIAGIFNSVEFLFNKKYNTQSLDYLIIFCTFINQFIFLFVDVTFFPIFMFICTMAICTLVVKNQFVKIIFTPLMVLPFLIYGNQVISAATLTQIDSSYLYNYRSFFYISLAFYPVFIMFFRHINGFLENHKSPKKVILVNAAVSVFLIAGCLIFSTIFYTSIKKKLLINHTIIHVDSDDSIVNLNYYDKKVFDNTIRFLELEIPENSVKSQVIVYNNRANPILYSDNSYVQLSKNTASFLIPDYPPEKMSFSYGIPEKQSTIKIIVDTQINGNEFNRIEKSFIIKE